MLEIIIAGGWMMLPILLCSVIAVAIGIERAWSLSHRRILPDNLLIEVWGWIKNNQLDSDKLKALKEQSPLGRILAVGLANSKYGRNIMKECIEEEAGHVIHGLERYLDTLGIIAAISPLLGLLGTVFGMIKIFSVMMGQGASNVSALAGGISEALITTAAGLSVAIPALVLHRYFVRRVDNLVVELEQEARKLVEVLHSERDLG